MAFASLWTLLDDIVAVLDDVALMTKMAAKKTAGVVGDDLALNATQVTGLSTEREWPVIWAVAKGSLLNKLILIPVALLLAVFAPAWITPLLMLGGAYLSFEGVEKILHSRQKQTAPPPLDEGQKIRAAIRTDFILSAEIMVIALGELQQSALPVQILVLLAIGLGMTVLVYGLVAMIVKMDDLGAYLQRQSSRMLQQMGLFLLWLMPRFMRALSLLGLLAMFLVSGGIFTHHLAPLHQALAIRGWLGLPADFAVGFLVGVLACLLILPLQKRFRRPQKSAS